jgi:hypothetical protein
MEGRDEIAKARTGSQVSSGLHALPCKHCDPHCQKSSGNADPSCRPAKARSHFDVSYNVLLGVALHEASRHPRDPLPLGLDPNLVLFDRARRELEIRCRTRPPVNWIDAVFVRFLPWYDAPHQHLQPPCVYFWHGPLTKCSTLCIVAKPAGTALGSSPPDDRQSVSTLRGSAIVSKLRGVVGTFFSTAERYWGGPVARFTVYAEISEQGVCGRGEEELFFWRYLAALEGGGRRGVKDGAPESLVEEDVGVVKYARTPSAFGCRRLPDVHCDCGNFSPGLGFGIRLSNSLSLSHPPQPPLSISFVSSLTHSTPSTLSRRPTCQVPGIEGRLEMSQGNPHPSSSLWLRSEDETSALPPKMTMPL